MDLPLLRCRLRGPGGSTDGVLEQDHLLGRGLRRGWHHHPAVVGVAGLRGGEETGGCNWRYGGYRRDFVPRRHLPHRLAGVHPPPLEARPGECRPPLRRRPLRGLPAYQLLRRDLVVRRLRHGDVCVVECVDPDGDGRRIDPLQRARVGRVLEQQVCGRLGGIHPGCTVPDDPFRVVRLPLGHFQSPALTFFEQRGASQIWAIEPNLLVHQILALVAPFLSPAPCVSAR
mmetsp:Transcript_131859/g.421849  ORF Transcript_131859/g.421849 Transcript_131859/m.421849 type:complete len:229 (-) Transcript_131859:69-755(-)